MTEVPKEAKTTRIILRVKSYDAIKNDLFATVQERDNLREKIQKLKQEPLKIMRERLDRLKAHRAGSIFTQSEEIAQEWLLRSMLGEDMERTVDISKRLNEIRRFGGVAFRDWDAMEKQVVDLKKRIGEAQKILNEPDWRAYSYPEKVERLRAVLSEEKP